MTTLLFTVSNSNEVTDTIRLCLCNGSDVTARNFYAYVTVAMQTIQFFASVTLTVT
jgi:hypothetical protein